MSHIRDSYLRTTPEKGPRIAWRMGRSAVVQLVAAGHSRAVSDTTTACVRAQDAAAADGGGGVVWLLGRLLGRRVNDDWSKQSSVRCCRRPN